MVVSQEGNLFSLLGCDVEDDPEFLLPSNKKPSKGVKPRKQKTEEQLRELKAPFDRTAKRIEYQPRLGEAKPYAVRTKSNDKNNYDAEAKAERFLLLVKEATNSGAQKANNTTNIKAVPNSNHQNKSSENLGSESINAGADGSSVQHKNPTVSRNSNRQRDYVVPNLYNQRNDDWYSQRNNNNKSHGGFRGSNVYQQRNRGYNGAGAGYERKISSEEISAEKVRQDNDDNSWSYVGRRGRVSKMGSVSEDLNSKSESIEGSDYSSRALEQQSAAGEDSLSVQATSEGDAQMTAGEEGSKKKSMGKPTEGRKDTKPKEEQKPTLTLKEYDAQQAEKRKALEALKKSEQRKVEDKEFESMKLIGGKKEEDRTESVAEKANSNKERSENKAPKAIPITEFVAPGEDELLIEKPDGTWFLVKRQRAYERAGRVIRQQRFRKGNQEEKNEVHNKTSNSGSSQDTVPPPPLDETTHFPGLHRF